MDEINALLEPITHARFCVWYFTTIGSHKFHHFLSSGLLCPYSKECIMACLVMEVVEDPGVKRDEFKVSSIQLTFIEHPLCAKLFLEVEKHPRAAANTFRAYCLRISG